MEPMTTGVTQADTFNEKLILGMSNAGYIGLKITTNLNCDKPDILPPLPLIPLEFSPKHEGKKVANLGGMNVDVDRLEVIKNRDFRSRNYSTGLRSFLFYEIRLLTART